MVEETSSPEPRSSPIDWPATFAGAAAAVTVALLLSTLGAAGTIIGAALGSVVATISSVLYKQGIESSRRRVVAVQSAALQRVNLADRDLRRAEGRPDVEGDDALLEEPDAEPSDESVSRWKDLPWRRIALFTVAVFVAALIVISVIELIAGRSVSTITGGTDDAERTSITGVFGDDTDTDRDRHSPTDEGTVPTTEPTSEATTELSVEPSESSTPTDTASPTEPTPTPTDATTDPSISPTEPTESPSATP